MYIYIYICCAFAGDSCQKSKPGNEKRKSEVSGSYRVTKPGGALGYFLGEYVPPGTPNCHPVLEKSSPKIDTPF